MAPSFADVRRSCRRLIAHTGKTEACIGVHTSGNTYLRGGAQESHCLTKGLTTDRRGGFADALNVVRSITPGLEAQADGYVPCMGTNSCEAAFREFPYCRARIRKRRFKFPNSPDYGIRSFQRLRPPPRLERATRGPGMNSEGMYVKWEVQQKSLH